MCGLRRQGVSLDPQNENTHMAIYHFSASMIGRSAGRSSVASAAYRAGEKLTNEREGITHDYTNKKGVDHSLIIAPDNCPDWVHDRNQLWNNVEAIEKRKDAQLAREITIALPAELLPHERYQLVKNFAVENFVNKGMIADIAFHDPDSQGDQRNYHAHIMLTTREITANGFGNKNRSWNDKSLLKEWRENWEQSINKWLERKGIDERVSAKTLAEQGIDRIPTKHIGVTAVQMERKGIRTERGDLHRAILEFNKNLESSKEEIEQTENELNELLAEKENRKVDIHNRFEVLEYLAITEEVKELEERITKVPLITAEQVIGRDLQIKNIHDELERKNSDIVYYKRQMQIAKSKFEEQDKKFFGGKKHIKELAQEDYSHNYRLHEKAKNEIDELKTSMKQRARQIVDSLSDMKDKMIDNLKDKLKPLYERLERFGGREAMEDNLNEIKERTGLTELSSAQRFDLSRHQLQQERSQRQENKQEQSRGMRL